MKTHKLTEVKWGIIGAGDVCEVKSAPAMAKIPHSSIAAIMRRNAAKAKDYASRHGINAWYTDADQLINDPNVNAIYVATPPNAHCEYVLRAAAAGKPVYVEKPMANTTDECRQMLKACSETNTPLFVAYYRRTLPHFLKVKSLIDEGILGDIRQVEIRMAKPIETGIVAASDKAWRLNPEVGRGGYFADLATHQIDALDFLLGPIRHVNGFASNQAGAYKTEDIVTSTFVFESGVHGVGSWCFNSHALSDRDETIIMGSKGQVTFPTFGGAELDLLTADGQQHFEFELPEHIQTFLIEQVVNELRSEGRCVSTGETALRTNLVMDAIFGANR